MEPTSVTYAVWPDEPELRMLRALVREGIAASRQGQYAVQFHGWRLRIRRCDSPPVLLVHVEIRYPNGTMWARFAWQPVQHVADKVD
ncbi:hypothetical protein [Burkholderia multivorans]|uniref:hypothetical protein n=1 Tax=Burkholderia multivorans TaxID=87883 RepID=UPI001C23EF68|nr:hypothetical protein [Burkholderia multivorans]MBU9363480.1 hypothetical protein [Burkholderia multivorans]